MIRWFKRRRPPAPAAPERPSDEDIQTAWAWGWSLDEWRMLSDTSRTYYRENITTAPRFKATA